MGDVRSRKAAENKPAAPPQDVQPSMDQGVEGVHANPVCVPRIHFAATTSGTMCAPTCANRIAVDAIKAQVLQRVAPMVEGDVPLPRALAATGANAKTVCAHLIPTAVKPLGMLPACRNAQTNAEGAVEEQHQLVEMMVAFIYGIFGVLHLQLRHCMVIPRLFLLLLGHTFIVT